ncbi:hypothetical protein PDL71_10220 [Lacibacter sp. MH-610]|uniref:hypothetical protein n=1 Tax=Lacibacter sp. MH-610 TaxID=3020883 RepID=UPI003892CACC
MSKTIHTTENTNTINGFLIQLRIRNPLLYTFGWINIAGAIICLVLIQITTTEVLGINAWIKPMKFFLSIGILAFTMSWYMVYLNNRKAVKRYSWVMILTMLIEMSIIIWQAANGRLSHFNISTQLYGILFQLMGIVITVFTLWTLYIGILFFKQKDFPPLLPQGYIWGIRLGIIWFVIFAFEGGHMAAQLAHTIGAPDGSEGLPVLNWSKQYGDLRVTHFFGMHSLQVLPIAGFYFAKSKGQLITLALVWFVFVMLLYWQALAGYPLL